LKEIHLSEPK